MRRDDAARVMVRVEVDPLEAFEVFTEEIDLWWKRGPAFRSGEGVLRFEPGPEGYLGGRLVQVPIEAGGEAAGELREIGRVLAWEPGRYLAFEYRGANFEPHQRTRVDVHFDASAGGTMVMLRHGGWDGLPQDHPVRHGKPPEQFARDMGGWWQLQLRSLRGRTDLRPSSTENP